MPGSVFELRCQGCEALHRIEPGGDRCHEHGQRWRYEQRVCSSGARGDELEPWSGRVWHERDPGERPGAERVAGLCPRCQATLRESDSEIIGRWD